MPSIIIVASLYLDMDTNRKHDTRLYHHLTASNVKELLEAVAQTSGSSLCNGRLIQARHHDVFGKNRDPKALVGTLREAINANLIINDKTNEEYEPVITWRCKLLKFKL